ncbi:MAG: DegT/DnrJ/EryC1/StrS family aminotransferase [Candidatus Hydrogenedentota bacterium]|nr:MAG: DegT/DnrJ/EryC1/StrS family aminotransferase [Candidatus Hydrogenedentota bacterium]
MIPVFRPSVGEEEIEAVAEVLRSGWLGSGPKTEAFEEAFARFIGVKHAVAVNSATAALHLALKTAEVEGGEVITTPMTFISTNHAILYNNATPVFCDIEPETLNIDVSKVESLINDRTRAILVVHFGGYAVDMEPLLALAQRYKLKVIEDAAHGCGGEYRSRRLGSIGNFGCFSFHAVKNLSCGDGGMITTNDANAARRLRSLRWMGISRDTWGRSQNTRYNWEYRVEELGFKYQMNDIAAAIGLVQLSRLQEKNRRREEITRLFSERLQGIEELGLPVRKDYMTRPAYHNYVIRTKRRDELSEFLKGKGIATSVHYFPNNLYPIYRHFEAPTPVCHRIWKTLLTIPLFPDLKDSEVDYIVSSIHDFFIRARRNSSG